MKFAAALMLALVADSKPENWPGWRGLTADGLSRETGVPIKVGSHNLKWKTPIPGTGHSSPIVCEDSVFVTTATDAVKPSQRLLLRLDRHTGKAIWSKVVLETGWEELHRLNSRASSTPATDGERIYISFLDNDKMFVAAYDFGGNKVWEARPGPFASKHGYCANPVIYKNWLIVNGDHDGDAFIAILDRKTGATVQLIPRENKLRSYSTPIIANIDGRDQLLIVGSRCTAGYDVLTGERQWICDGPSEQMVATLLRGHGLIFSLGGYPERRLLAIREGGKGEITSTHVKWRATKGVPYVPSALLYGDLLHVVSDEGIYTSYDARSGKVHAQERLTRHVSASLVGAENHVYIVDDEGKLFVLDSQPGMHLLTKSQVGEEVYASPAISHGALFIRGVNHVFCYD